MTILLITVVDQPNEYAAGYTVKKWSNNNSMVTERILTENFKKTKPKIFVLNSSGMVNFCSKNENNNIPFHNRHFFQFFHSMTGSKISILKFRSNIVCAWKTIAAPEVLTGMNESFFLVLENWCPKRDGISPDRYRGYLESSSCLISLLLSHLLTFHKYGLPTQSWITDVYERYLIPWLTWSWHFHCLCYYVTTAWTFFCFVQFQSDCKIRLYRQTYPSLLVLIAVQSVLHYDEVLIIDNLIVFNIKAPIINTGNTPSCAANFSCKSIHFSF